MNGIEIGNRCKTLFNLKYSEFCKNCGKCVENGQQACKCKEYIPVEYSTQILENGECYIINNFIYDSNEIVKFVLPDTATCAVCANNPRNHAYRHLFSFNVLLLYDKNKLECKVYSGSAI